MSEFFFTKLKKSKNFSKESGRVEVWALLNPQSTKKSYISIYGSKPLTPCVIDNTLLKYVVFAEKIINIKNFNYIPCFNIDGLDKFHTYFPFPEEYIYSKLNKTEKMLLESYLQDCETKQVKFFQAMVMNEK